MPVENPEERTPPLSDFGREPRWLVLGNSSALIRFLLLVASGWAMVQLLVYFQVLVVVFVSSTILAFLLNYLATGLSRWLPRRIAVIGVFFTFLALTLGFSLTLGTVVISQGQQLAVSVEDFSNTLVPWLTSMAKWLARFNIPLNIQGLELQLQNQAMGMLTVSLGFLQSKIGRAHV